MDDTTSGRTTAREPSDPACSRVHRVIADELPDGLVIADEAGRVVLFNRAAARLTSTAAEEAIGKLVADVLPFRDADDRDWWLFVDPYHGLSTRTRHPERSLYLTDGTELLVTVGYVREGERSGPVRRLVISLVTRSASALTVSSMTSFWSSVKRCHFASKVAVKPFTLVSGERSS